MLKLTKYEDCFVCRDCCTFYKEGNDREAAPLFTPEEKLIAEKIIPGENFVFLEKKKMFQAKLVDYSKDKELFACVFLDHETHACRIYKDRPFDCKIWPYIIIKNPDGKIELRLFDKQHCPSMGKLDDESISKYTGNFMKRLERYYPMIKENPGMILDYDDDYFELTHHVCFLKELEGL